MQHRMWRPLAGAVACLVVGSAFAAETNVGVSPSSVITGPNPTPFNFVISRSGDLSQAIQVDYRTQDGSALAGTHYNASAGTLNLPAFASFATVPVTALPAVDGATRTLELVLENPQGGSASLSFAPQQQFAVGDAPRGVATLDVNGDGLLDVATTDFDANTITVLINQTPAGSSSVTFGPPTVLAGGFPSCPADVIRAGDMNGDGKPDLVAGNCGFNVFLNTTPEGASTASFAPAQTGATGGHSPFSLLDINTDGRLDVMGPSAFSYAVSINTTPANSSVVTFSPQSYSMNGDVGFANAPGDFNADGKPELVANGFFQQLLYIPVNATPTGSPTYAFTPLQSYNLFSAANSAMAVADLNNDEMQDIVLGGSQIYGYFNQTSVGAPTVSLSPATPLGIGAGADQILAVDLDADGFPEIVKAAGGAALDVYRNLIVPGSTTPAFAAPLTLATGNYPNAIASGDLNGDGRPDLVSANRDSDSISVLINQTNVLTITLSPDRATGTLFPPPLPPAPTVTLAVAPAAVTFGQSATATWSSTNATSCTKSGDWTGTASTSGSQAVTPASAGAKVYTMTCSGPGGSGSASANLAVAKAATVLDARPYLAQILPGLPINLRFSAVLKTTTGQTLAGRSVSFAAGSAACTGITNSSGVASCGVIARTLPAVILAGGYSAQFAGDTNYAGSSDTASLLSLFGQ